MFLRKRPEVGYAFCLHFPINGFPGKMARDFYLLAGFETYVSVLATKHMSPLIK